MTSKFLGGMRGLTKFIEQIRNCQNRVRFMLILNQKTNRIEVRFPKESKIALSSFSVKKISIFFVPVRSLSLSLQSNLDRLGIALLRVPSCCFRVFVVVVVVV